MVEEMRGEKRKETVIVEKMIEVQMALQIDWEEMRTEGDGKMTTDEKNAVEGLKMGMMTESPIQDGGRTETGTEMLTRNVMMIKHQEEGIESGKTMKREEEVAEEKVGIEEEKMIKTATPKLILEGTDLEEMIGMIGNMALYNS